MPIYAFTMVRSGRSRWAVFRIEKRFLCLGDHRKALKPSQRLPRLTVAVVGERRLGAPQAANGLEGLLDIRIRIPARYG